LLYAISPIYIKLFEFTHLVHKAGVQKRLKFVCSSINNQSLLEVVGEMWITKIIW